MSNLEYQGRELELFSHAKNWKRYWSKTLRPYIGGRVLEVGAGMGANTPVMQSGRVSGWTCLEPDSTLVTALRAKRASGEMPQGCEIVHGTLAELPPGDLFDTVLYIDVMEHIADDAAEFQRATQVLAPGGHLV